MTKKIKIIVGVCALVLAIALNTRHALNGYGVNEINLHVEALPGEPCFRSAGYEPGMPMGIVVTYCGRCVRMLTIKASRPDNCRD